jgi:hypothetical protein
MAKKKEQLKDKRVKYQDSLVVLRLAKENPKKPGSASRDRFERYPEGPTSVADLLAIEGGPTRADLIWDSERGFIAVGTREEVEKAQEAAAQEEQPAA